MFTAQILERFLSELTDPHPEKIEAQNILRWEDDGGQIMEPDGAPEAILDMPKE